MTALKAWSMDAGPTGPAVKEALPPHKGGPSLGATSPVPKPTMVPQGMTPVKAAENLLTAIKDGNVTQRLYWSNISALLAAGDAAGAVSACLKAISTAFQAAAVGLDFETALSSQASRTFDEPLTVLTNGEEEIRFTIERRPIRPQIKQGTANPAPVGAGVSKSAAVTVVDGKVVAIASDDNIPAKTAKPIKPMDNPAYLEFRNQVAEGLITREDGEIEVADAEEKRLGREVTEAEMEAIVAFFDIAVVADTMPDPE